MGFANTILALEGTLVNVSESVTKNVHYEDRSFNEQQFPLLPDSVNNIISSQTVKEIQWVRYKVHVVI